MSFQRIDPALYEGKAVCFDTETTGFAKWDEIIQISVVNEDEQEILTTFVRPDHVRSWTAAEEINHISPQMVKDAPTMQELYGTLKSIFDGASQILGYNVAFDLRMVEQCCPYRFDREKVTDVKSRFMKDKKDKESHKLIDAVRFYVPDYYEEFSSGAHKADADTFATVRVWKKQNEGKEIYRQMRLPGMEPDKTEEALIEVPEGTAPCYAGIGSRKTPREVLAAFEEIGKILGQRGFTLRSGRALGADMAFETGCDKGFGKKEIFLPWRGFNKAHYQEQGTPDSIVWASVGKNAYKMAEKFHPFFGGLSGAAISLMGRNTYQIFGECDEHEPNPSAFVICYTPEGSGRGGTGQAIRMAKRLGIPVFDAGRYENENGKVDVTKMKSDFWRFLGRSVRKWEADKEQVRDLAKEYLGEEKDFDYEH